MPGQRTRRRRSSTSYQGPTRRQIQAMVLCGSFAVGVGLEWLRSLPTSSSYSWRSDTLAVLLAAWASVALLLWWPRGREHPIRTAGLLLLVLYLGTLLAHELINAH